VRCAKTALRSRHRSLFARNRVKTNINERMYKYVPILALPKKRPLLVEDEGGGGL
jgi:hypothetical protein